MLLNFRKKKQKKEAKKNKEKKLVVVECILCPYIPKGSLPPPPNIFLELWILKTSGRCFYRTEPAPAKKKALAAIGKLAEKAFVNYDPIRAIKENSWQAKGKQPTNYRGRSAPKEPIFSAQYNGEWGMYTQADIDTYHMEVYKQ